MNSKSKILFVGFLLLSLTSHAQPQKEHDRYAHLDSNLTYKTALKDIAMHKMKIFGQGGIDPVAYSRVDSIFEANYKITYILFGCESPYNAAEMKEYNEEIGKYLDKLNGKAWRKELHPDVLALLD
jgi:hypothetical protein